MAIPPDGYLGDPNRTTAEYQQGIDDLTEALNDPTTGLDAKAATADLGTAAYVDTGTGSGDVPLNSQLGTAAARDVGTGSTQLPTTAEADARYLIGSNNLSDLTNDTTARSNLGVYSTSQVDSKIENANWVLKWSGSATTRSNSWGAGTYMLQTTNTNEMMIEVKNITTSNQATGGSVSASFASSTQWVAIHTNSPPTFRIRFFNSSFVASDAQITAIWKNEP